MVKLAEKTDETKPQSVNVGGLVIVVIRDSGSRPPQDVSVVAPDSLEPLGVVRGVQNDQGVALMGGGYTWHLFKPAEGRRRDRESRLHRKRRRRQTGRARVQADRRVA